MLEVLRSFADVSETEWNALERSANPFLDHRFLLSLEEAQCLGAQTGWHPLIICYREPRCEPHLGPNPESNREPHSTSHRLAGALPLYLKTNSYGEYIFDWAWANASEQAQVPYYPKLVSAVPFTPVTVPKFLVHPLSDATTVRTALLQAARELQRQTDSSSIHFLFSTEEESAFLESKAFLQRHSFQYHWHNRDYTSFDDFLSSLRSKRRNEIRRERAHAQQLDLTYRMLTSDDLTPEHPKIMYEFYLAQIQKMNGILYLNERFFELLFTRMPEAIALALAFDSSGKAVAAALNLYSPTTLYGRYWGSADEFKNLHFELCYYQGIEWAITHGLNKFEAGAQGEHKFNRGFLPTLCHSSHQITYPPLHRAVDGFLASEKQGLAELFLDYKAHDPYKRDPT